MPELPEVETVRAGLSALVSGTTVVTVHVRRDSCVRLLPGGASQFAGMLEGARIVEVARRGKFLWMPLLLPGDSVAEDALSAHLGMSGQFRVHEGAEAPEPHAHCRARVRLDRDGVPLTLDFLDQRTFGYLHVESLVPSADGLPGGAGTALAALPRSVAHIGRDALDPALDESEAALSWRAGRRGIKQVLLDQRLVSGIGNIYADEALWAARVHPERPAHAVAPAQARALLAASRAVMARALQQGGTSFDSLYVNVNGESGYFSRSLEAYGRSGEPCSRCAGAIALARIGGRATHWCPRCQRRYTPRR